MRACFATTGITSSANGVFQCKKRVFHPRLADLFEARVIVRAPAHAIQVLRNDRVIGLGQLKPIDWLVAIVARVRSYSQSDLCPYGRIKLCHVLDISNNNIRTGHKIWHSGTDCMLYGWHDH